MATRLVSEIAVINLAAGASITRTHGLNVRGYPRLPDKIFPGHADLEISNVTAMTLTITNVGAVAVDAAVRVEYDHSAMRAFGGAATPAPFVVRGGGGGGSASQFIAAPVTTPGNEDTTITGNVLANTTSPTGTLSVQQFIVPGSAGEPSVTYGVGATAAVAGKGALIIQANGAFTFTPLPNFVGPVGPIAVWITNESELRTVALTVHVTAVNDAPTAGTATRLSVTGEPVVVDLLAYCHDIEGDTLTITAVNGAPPVVGAPVAVTDGTVVYQGAGVVQVTPAIVRGEITFPFTVADVAGLTATATALIRVGVDNIPLFSPIAPLVAGNAADDELRGVAPTFLQERSSRWPNIGPNGGPVDLAFYTSARGFYVLTSREPWLYDRATMAWLLWMRTGDLDARAAALAWAELYMQNVVVSSGRGSFTIDGATDDVKYMYPAIAWWYEYETGNPVYRDKAAALYNGILYNWPKTYVVGPRLFTERGHAFAMLGCLAQHAITGDQQPLTDATEYAEGIFAISGSGAPLHGHDQHEGDSTTTPITSPWMGAFLAESMVQLYRFTEDARVLTWLSNYGDWLIAHATYVVETPDEPEFVGMVGLRLFAYLAGAAGPTDFGQADDMRHARDIQELYRKVVWAKGLLSLDTTAAEAMVVEQGLVAAVSRAYFRRTTPGLPEERANPSREPTWKFRNGYSDGVYFVGVVPLAPILLTASTLSGAVYEGSTVTLTPATWNGRPTPTVTYAWLRDGVVIAGETGLSYVLQASDVNHVIAPQTTATNAGGTASSTATGITVLAAGSPQFTTQPVSVTREVGQTATFTVAVIGTPTPTLQWQRRATSGDAWANVSEGTGGLTDTYVRETLAAPDNGAQVRCIATNVLGSVTSDVATIAMIVQQPAAAFTSTQGALLATTSPQLGGVGLTDFTMTALVRFVTMTHEAPLLIADSIAERLAGLAAYAPSATATLSVRDQLGHITFADPPPANTWIAVAARMPADPGGAIIGSWQLAESPGAVRTAVNLSAIEASLTAVDVRVGAGTSGAGGQAFEVQYVGIYDRILSDAEILAQRTAPDYATAYSFWVFSDAGGSVLTVRDASGNGRVPTLSGGAVITDGPVAPTVP